MSTIPTLDEPLRIYTVKRGDTLTGIALAELGNADRFVEIAELNELPDASLIYPDQSLLLPIRRNCRYRCALMNDAEIAAAKLAYYRVLFDWCKKKITKWTALEKAASQKAKDAITDQGVG